MMCRCSRRDSRSVTFTFRCKQPIPSSAVPFPSPHSLYLEPQGIWQNNHAIIDEPSAVAADALTPSPLDILGQAHSLKVFCPDTGWVEAKVVESQFIWDRADEFLIGEPMSKVDCPTNVEYPVAFLVAASYPDPTATLREWWNEHDVVPEAVGQAGIAECRVRLRLHRKATPFGVMQPEVSCLAAASIVPQPRAFRRNERKGKNGGEGVREGGAL